MNKRLRKKFNQRISRHVRKLRISPNDVLIVTVPEDYPHQHIDKVFSHLRDTTGMTNPIIGMHENMKVTVRDKERLIKYLQSH